VEQLKDWADIASNVATVIAIVVGGVWTYVLFVRQRLKYPRAELGITAQHATIASDKRLLHVALRIANTGHVLLRPRYAELRVRQVLPLDHDIGLRLRPNWDPVLPGQHELEWPLIVDRHWHEAFEIEPGESDTLHADFVIDCDIAQVQLYAFVGNPTGKRRNFGWPSTCFVDLREDGVSEDRTTSGDFLEKQQETQQQRQGQQERQQLQKPTQTSQQQSSDAGSKDEKK
jgi:hypothetical protein